MFRSVLIALVIALFPAWPVHAQGTTGQSSRWRATWTIVGAGAGFGVGVWAGLTAFDDAINSDRKVWTSAIVGAAIGGVGGYFIGRAQDRRGSSPARAFRPIDQPIVEDVARSFSLRR